MGYRALATSLYHSKATGTTKLVLLAISHFHDDLGENGAYPSQNLLAKMANVSVRQVQRAINELVRLEEIEVLVHAGKGATFDRQTNRYFLILDCSETCDSSLNHRDLGDTEDRPTRHIGQTYTTPKTDLHDTYDVLTVKNIKEHKETLIGKRALKLA
jgi:hypothetical protein